MHMVIYRKVYKDSAFILEKKRDWLNKMAGKLFCIYTKADWEFFVHSNKVLTSSRRCS